jgi:hypothetical protein
MAVVIALSSDVALALLIVVSTSVAESYAVLFIFVVIEMTVICHLLLNNSLTCIHY